MLTRLTRIPLFYRIVQRLLTDSDLTNRVVKDGLRYLPGARVLDLGCGPGLYADLVSDEDYVGIDISPQYIDIARQRHPKKEFRVLDVVDLGSLEGHFDRVLILGVLHHLPDDDVLSTLRAVQRVLHPNGFCFVAEAIWPERRWDVAGWIVRKLDAGDYVRRYARWLQLLEPFGVRDDRLYYNKLLPCITLRLEFNKVAEGV